jgi:hypothetical protein
MKTAIKTMMMRRMLPGAIVLLFLAFEGVSGNVYSGTGSGGFFSGKKEYVSTYPYGGKTQNVKPFSKDGEPVRFSESDRAENPSGATEKEGLTSSRNDRPEIQKDGDDVLRAGGTEGGGTSNKVPLGDGLMVLFAGSFVYALRQRIKGK